jgi:hypothetical protein
VKVPKRFGYLAALCVVLLPALVSCKQLVVKTPAGFAALQSADQYAAMSPEGMIYRVRVMHNSPKQSLSFWTEALTNHLQQEGYVPVSTDNEFQAGTLRGTFSEWSVPYADDTYKYLTGILVGDETIAVVEATSSHDVYDRHRAAVLESLESVDFQGVEAKGFAQKQAGPRPSASTSKAEEKSAPAPAGGCFAAGTPVLTEDGPTPIEAVWPGTRLAVYDPPTGRWGEQLVVRSVELPYHGEVVTLEVDGQTLEVTGNHPVLVSAGRGLERRPLPDELPAAESLSPIEGRWVEARHLRRGDLLTSLAGTHGRIESISRRVASARVYHLAVSGPHTYAVQSSGFVVHNGGQSEAYKAPVESKQAVREREIIAGGAVSASLPTETQGGRVRVYSGACSLVIDRVEETKRRISDLAEHAGGYVEQSTEERIVVRVPAAVFRNVFDGILELGEVAYKAIETYDVTDQFTDPAGRLAVAVRARDRLYVLLNRVEDPKERLEILKKIREYSETIERLELSLQVLEQRIAMSRITVELHPRMAETPGAERPIPFPWIARLHPLYTSTAALGGKATVTLPEDVAVFQEGGVLRAEAADGTRIRAGIVGNDPRGDSLFWRQALVYHLGPKYKEAEAIDVGPVSMALFTSKDRDPYYYLVGAAPLPEERTLVVFEVYFPDGGALERHRRDLLDAFQQVELK